LAAFYCADCCCFGNDGDRDASGCARGRCGVQQIFIRLDLGLAGITSSFGRVIFGFIADRLSKQAAYTLNIAMTVVGVGALMILSDSTQVWLLYIYVVFFGIGFGSRAVIFSALTADIFSGKGFGSILGYSTVAVGVGGALGSWLGGAFYDWTGSYLISFALSTVVLSISDVCIWLAAVPSVANSDKRLWAAESTRANLRDAQ
jgi:MFS family permease